MPAAPDSLPTASASAVALKAALESAFPSGSVEVQDDSHLHAGHAGAREGSHFTVRLVSERFAGLARVARHRLVYSSLGSLPAMGIHALVIEARAPEEA
jgi:BolA protein